VEQDTDQTKDIAAAQSETSQTATESSPDLGEQSFPSTREAVSLERGVYREELEIAGIEKIMPVIEELDRLGFKSLVVGGAVRDSLMDVEPKDIDIEVYGINYEQLATFLSEHGEINLVGKSFGIVKFHIDSESDFDFSVPRSDNKIGIGHKDFAVTFDAEMTPEKAVSRRDFTWNALAYDPINGEIHDYFGGREDLENKIIRATSSAFSEDPLRVLRGMQFAARFNMEIEPETAELCRQMGEDFASIPKERVAEEWMKLVTKGNEPGRIFDYLQKTSWIEHYPELKALVGVPQDPVWHPEGTVEVHTAHVLNAAAWIAIRDELPPQERAVLIFSALCHDLAKATTTLQRPGKDGELRWTSHGHESEGGALTEQFLSSIGIKREIIEQVVPLVENHLRHVDFASETVSPRVIQRLSERVKPSNIQMLSLVIEADHSGRPPLAGGLPKNAQKMLAMAEEYYVKERAPEPLLMGRDVLAQGVKPGKHVGTILREAYEMQLEGAFFPKVPSALPEAELNSQSRENALNWLIDRLRS